MKNVVLIAGVHGVSGRAAAEHWISIPGTQVYGLSRRSAPLPAGVEVITADLLDRDDLQRKLGKIGGITHIVGRFEAPTQSALKFRGVTLHPPPDGQVVDQKSTLSKEFLHVTVRQ